MQKTKEIKRLRRKKHIRKTVNGTATAPRVYVFKSNKYMTAGVTNDENGVVLTGSRANRTMDGAKKLAQDIAKSLTGKKITNAVFDRSGYKYHGLIAKFVESLRENGIKI